MSKRIGRTDSGRTIITSTGEEPKSARASKRWYQLWKMVQDISPEEIEFLISKRRNQLKYEKDFEEINNLRTDISVLEDAYKINKRKRRK